MSELNMVRKKDASFTGDLPQDLQSPLATTATWRAGYGYHSSDEDSVEFPRSAAGRLPADEPDARRPHAGPSGQTSSSMIGGKGGKCVRMAASWSRSGWESPVGRVSPSPPRCTLTPLYLLM